MQINKKALIITGIFLGSLLFLLVSLSVLSPSRKNPASQTAPATSITSYPSRFRQRTKDIPPLSIKDAPTFPPSQGGGIDTTSAPVKESMAEIKKLLPSLPYSADTTLSTGVTISILIPEASLQSNAWTLTVQIFNLNYQTTPADSDYTLMKKSFIEASSTVFNWMEKKGANPSKVMINWGDKKYIQDKAIKWLSPD